MNNDRGPSQKSTVLIVAVCFATLASCLAIVITSQVIDAKRPPIVQSSKQTFEQMGTGGVYRK